MDADRLASGTESGSLLFAAELTKSITSLASFADSFTNPILDTILPFESMASYDPISSSCGTGTHSNFARQLS